MHMNAKLITSEKLTSPEKYFYYYCHTRLLVSISHGSVEQRAGT